MCSSKLILMFLQDRGRPHPASETIGGETPLRFNTRGRVGTFEESEIFSLLERIGNICAVDPTDIFAAPRDNATASHAMQLGRKNGRLDSCKIRAKVGWRLTARGNLRGGERSFRLCIFRPRSRRTSICAHSFRIHRRLDRHQPLPSPLLAAPQTSPYPPQSGRLVLDGRILNPT